MSLKTIVKGRPNKGNTNNELIKYGLFAIKGRLFDKIIKKQIEVVQNLDYYLNE
jgi:dual specificity tyrosine-phosphorylation-regulated kinase 2/3/4